jgi:anti-sigma regulatory factor (Ser/Thr protein kinase)
MEAISASLGEPDAFRHEALIYAGEGGFVESVGAFIRDGVESGATTLVVVGARKLEWLRESLNGATESVLFADMAEVGANPARIIPAWREFVSTHAPSGARLRGVGEPIYPERRSEELVECQRHESLLNLAFNATAGFWLVCPYDRDALAPEVIAEARHSHPYLMGHDGASVDYRGLEAIARPFSAPLPPAPAAASQLRFDLAGLRSIRVFVRAGPEAALLSPRRREELVLAVDELASNSIRHGGGSGVVRIWGDGDGVVCEVVDSGQIDDPLAGRIRQTAGSEGGYGLWIANQVCDLVQIRTSALGSTVRLHMRT